ncbi:MAG TPA: SDR family NAD(P)-dependent oxidoreductase, partial [Streptosporangiaceae bacterium]
AVDWAAVLGGGRVVPLPTYAFQHQRYWPEPAPAALVQAGGDGAGSEAEARFWAAVDGQDVRELAAALAVDEQAGLDQVVPVLASWRRRERSESAVASWRYRVAWVPAGVRETAALSGTWLVVAPAGAGAQPTAEPWARALASRGAAPVVVEVAAAETDRAALAEHIRAVLAGQESEATAACGVVSLLALDERPLTQFPAVPAGLAGTLTLTQALGDAEVPAPLWVVTRGAVAAEAGQPLPHPVQATAWGFGFAAGLEHPDRWGGLIDLPLAWDERVAARVCGVLAGCGETQVAVRGPGVLARRLVRATLPREDARGWAPQGAVLVTGGTGAVGGHVGRWLAGAGASHLVLVSRSGPPAAGAALLAAELAGLAQPGAQVSVLAGDVGERPQAAGLLDWVKAAGPPLAGIFHAAGVLDDGMLDGLDAARLARVLTVKASGAQWLDELTADTDLGAFVLFSSAAATLGSAGQGNYAAANAYLDALAHARRGRGQPGLSVAWGSWGGGGLAQAARVRRRLRRGGIAEMDPGLAVRALEQALAGADTALTVLDADWAQLAGGPAGPPPLLLELPEVARMASPNGRAGLGGASSELAGRLAALPEAEQVKTLTGVIRAEAAAVLGHASADAVAAGRVFRDLGFDSLTSVELRNRLAALTGLRLPVTLVFDYPTPVAVAQFVRARLAGERADIARARPPAPSVTAEPIAIVGMGCRYPGGVASPEDLWKLLVAGGDAIADVPADRGWDMAALYDPDPDHPGTSYTCRGGFMADAAEFDAGFFGISPREALAMDPQQRLLLEVCWEAIERAGIDPASLRGSRTGVYAGAAWSGYGAGLEGGSEGYLLTGTASAVISGRVSYTLGLEGPAVSVDTACSSSLVALHLACQALRAGECEMALAGGVMVITSPAIFVEFSRQRGLAVDGRCKAFGATADGIGWAEGAGMVVLERLSDARRNGHRVLAVISGSAMNQDGASNGLSAPNGPSQQRVIAAALAAAGITADQVDAVEAHGTGTKLGDPIEAQALLATYGQNRDRPLWLGSVKSNLGHTQLAAGVAGLIKVVLALQHQMLPRTLHATEPSPHIDWSSGAVRLLTDARPWAAGERPRRAGVSAFGISGTNVHAIVEEAPEAAEVAAAAPGDGGLAVLDPAMPAWLVSARTAAGLTAQARQLAGFAARRPELDPADVGWSLATTRSAFEHRTVITGRNRDELIAGLRAMAEDKPAAGMISGTVADDAGKVVFVFPGQGGQWAGMGRELAASSPLFAARLAECGRALAPYLDWSLEDVLAGADGAPALESADVVQPVLWALMVSLAAMWEAAGVIPDAVAGHSQGEIAAACVAGILSMDDAARVVALRSRALRTLAGRGGMLSVTQPAGQVREQIAGWADRLAVAAVNGPSATVVSGELAALAELAAGYATAGVRTRPVPVDYASHCAQVEQIRAEILTMLAPVTPGPALIPMISAMTGEWLQGPEAGAGYWYDSLRSAVEFDQAVRALAASGHGVFVEVSAHPVLTAAITETLESGPAATAEPVATGTLRRRDGGTRRFLASLAAVHVRGVPVDWTAVLPAGRPVELPTYAFQRRRYWPQPVAAQAGDVGAAGLAAVGHPLLGAGVELAGGEEYLLTGRLSVRSQPWLADHAVAGTVLVPGTAFVEMAIAAGTAAGCGRIDELTLEAPLALSADGAVQVQVTVAAAGDGGERAVEIYARDEQVAPGGPWRRHASGLLTPAETPDPALTREFAVWPPDGATRLTVDGLYEALAAGGYGYGPAFRGLRAAWRREGEVFADVALPVDMADAAGSFGLHPALLDAALHAAGLPQDGAGRPERDDGAQMPFSWTGVTLHATGAATLRVRIRPDHDGSLSLVAADGTGMPVVSVGSLVLRPAAGSPQAAANPRDALFGVEWVPIAAGPSAGDGLVPVVVAAGGVGCGAGVSGRDVAAVARAEVGRVLGVVQEWLAGDAGAGEVLVVVTQGAVAVVPGEGVRDLAGAAVWGLVRSAQSENPGRLVLVDVPPEATSGEPDVPAVVARAAGSGEPEVAVRDGVVYGRRLMRPAGVAAAGAAAGRAGMVLVTGGTGTLGGLVAGHLADTGRADVAVLVSRSGPGAAGVAGLAAGVAGRGAGVEIVACDVGVRDELAGLLERAGGGVPLRMVVHAAGVVDDGVIGSLSAGRVDAVMRPKTDGA